MALSFTNLEDLLPVLLGWITTGGVVGANVKHDDRLIGSGIKILEHTLEIEASGASIIVPVVLPWESRAGSDTPVSWPGGVWSVNGCIFVMIPLLDEVKTDSEGTSSGEGLASNNSLALNSLVVFTISQLNTMLVVGWDTVNTCVLVVHSVLKNSLFSCLNASKDQWLAIVVSVSSHTEKNFLWVGILLEGIVQTEDGIWRSGID